MSRSKLFLLSSVFLAVLLSGCSDYYAPVRDFLDEYTNSAAIGSQSISVPTERDRDGIECVSSDTDVTLTFFLRNPRSYEIDPDFQEISEEIINTIVQSADRQSITLTIPSSFLTSHEKGFDFSGTILLTEIPTGRAFPSWDFTLRCNTPPPRPEGARIMLLDDVASTTYVLCFNLDLTNPVHDDDIAVVTINNTDYYPTTVNAGGTQEITFGNNAAEFSSTPPGTLIAIPNQPAFVPDTSINQVYFKSGIVHSGATQNFTITVEDNMGLSRTASTSTAGNMLAPVTVTDSDGFAPTGGTLTLSPNTNGNYHVLLNHTDSSATIHYTFGGTSHTLSGSFPQTIEVSESGTLEVWATRTGYVPSDRVTVTLVCRNNQYYVDPASGDDDPTTPGTRSQPFQTIEHAITQFIDPTDADNTIFLLGNVTPANGGVGTGIVNIIPTEDITFIIDGREVPSNATIDGINSKRCLFVNATIHTVNLTLRNLSIRDGRVSGNGAGIYFNSTNSGSSLTLEGCVVEENDVVDGTSGGGVYFLGESLTISNGTSISSNTIYHTQTRGAGIYAAGVSATSTIKIIDSTISNNVGTATDTSGYGGGLYVQDAGLAVSEQSGTTLISNNTANTVGAGKGGGICIMGSSGNTVQISLSRGTISSNKASSGSSANGYGGGLYVDQKSTITLDGIQIKTNTASLYGAGRGGGICLYNQEITTTMSGTTAITGNYATKSSTTTHTGMGGGVFISGSATNAKSILTGTGGSISNNIASINTEGYGGGICISTWAQFKTTETSTTIMQNNYATESSSAIGYGGAISIASVSSVDWQSGTISENVGSPGMPYSQGEAVLIFGTTSGGGEFKLSCPLGDNSGTSGNAIYMNEQSVLVLSGEAALNSSNSIYYDKGKEIKTDTYLPSSHVANIVPSDYTWTPAILTGDATSINYYKFTVESDGGTDYCINADGELSRIYPVMANDAAGLANALSSPPINGSTLEIKLNNIMSNNSSFTIPANAHVRIIPNLNISFNHMANAQLFRIMNGGHLLFGDPDKPITVDCSTPREQNLFELLASGSLVLRNVTIKNASTGGAMTPSNAALVFSGATAGISTVVLEEFNYLEDTPLPVQSTLPALQISMGSEHHFVSGGITGFNVSDPGYGGVATFYGGGILFLYPGVVLSGNSEYMGSSITGVPPGVLYDNR